MFSSQLVNQAKWLLPFGIRLMVILGMEHNTIQLTVSGCRLTLLNQVASCPDLIPEVHGITQLHFLCSYQLFLSAYQFLWGTGSLE